MKKRSYLTLLSAVFLISILSIGGYTYLKRQSYKSVYDSLDVTLISAYQNPNDRVIEYGQTVDAEKILASPAKVIDTVVTDGFEGITYRVSTTDKFNQFIEKDIYINFVIQDSKPPIIDLIEDIVTIEVGEEYDPKNNIKDVYDIVDGPITPTIETNLDTKTPGTYLVTINATDIHDLTSSKTYTIEVKNKQVTKTALSSIEWSANGSAGVVRCGSYQAPLEYADIYDNAQRQVVIDSNAAGYSTTGAGIEYVGDHASQGFQETLNNNSIQIKRPDGSVDTFYKISTHKSSKDSWVTYDGIDVWSTAIGRLLTQVCVGDELVFIYWS